MQTQSSNFFKFNNKINDTYELSDYLGWNGLIVAKFELKQSLFLSVSNIDNTFKDLIGKQKIFVVVKGCLEIEIENKKKIIEIS